MILQSSITSFMPLCSWFSVAVWCLQQYKVEEWSRAFR